MRSSVHVIIDGPGLMPSIERIWCYVSVDEEGREGICAGPLFGPGSMVPLIAGDQRRLAQLTPIAEMIAKATGKTIRLVEFSMRTVHRDITGAST